MAAINLAKNVVAIMIIEKSLATRVNVRCNAKRQHREKYMPVGNTYGELDEGHCGISLRLVLLCTIMRRFIYLYL